MNRQVFLLNNSRCQVDEVGAAHPRITEAVETMMKKGKWTVPGKPIFILPRASKILMPLAGYKEKFGDMALM